MKMNHKTVFGVIVKQQARGETPVKGFPVCETGYLFFERKHTFHKSHVVSRNYKRLLHQDDSTKRILKVTNP